MRLTTFTHSVRPRGKPVLETGRPPRLPAALSRHAIRAFHSPHTAFRHPRVSPAFFDSRFDLTWLTVPPNLTRVAAPSGPESASVPSVPAQNLSLSDAIGTINAARKAYSTSALPPTPPTPFKRWIPERAPDAPHDPNAYFPMILVK